MRTLQRRREEDYLCSKHQCLLKTRFPLFNKKKLGNLCFSEPISTNFIAKFSSLEISKNKNTPTQDAARDGRNEKCVVSKNWLRCPPPQEVSFTCSLSLAQQPIAFCLGTLLTCNKAHGICECYHIVDSCTTDKRSWSSWLLVLWVPFTLQIGPLCDTNLFPSVLVWIAHSIAFINQLVACPLSKFQMFTGAVFWTLVIVQCFECGILVAEWLASASAMAALWRQGKDWIGCGVVPWAPINCKWH